MNYLSIALLWIVYCAFHSYLISIRFTNLVTSLLKSYYAFYRIAYVIISILLLVPLLKLSAQSNSQVIIGSGNTLSIVRHTLMAGSLLMFFWAFFFDYDSLSFWGIRQIMDFKRTKNSNPVKNIKTKGLLGITRHPMYFALIVYLWCQTFTMMDIVVNAILTLYVLVGTKLEERKLVLEFGDSYVRYQHQVPMLIPFIEIKLYRPSLSKNI
jgi:methanethiol S-methyltransferase